MTFVRSRPFRDLDFFRDLLEQNPGPALDVGCGTGRLLIPLLQAGFEVDGVDISPDLLQVCRDEAERVGVKPVLFEQPMQELNLRRKYRTVMVPCDAFYLVTPRGEAIETLRLFRALLEPGGLLAFNLDSPFETDGPDWNRGTFRDGWQCAGRLERPDGSQIEEWNLVERFDRIEQVTIGKVRFRVLVAGEVVREETYPWNRRHYFRNEVLTMLESTGFRDVNVYGDFTTEPFGIQHAQMIFVART